MKKKKMCFLNLTTHMLQILSAQPNTHTRCKYSQHNQIHTRAVFATQPNTHTRCKYSQHNQTQKRSANTHNTTKQKGPLHTLGARHGASVFAGFSPTQFSFSRSVPRCLNSKCICAHLCTHGRAGLKMRCVQA